jgi:rhodanese-related sulfurtransferase
MDDAGSNAAELLSSSEISREELLRRLHDPSLSLVDVLPREAFLAGHLPGSISLPVAEIASRAREVLPRTSLEIAVYCASPT